MITVIDTDALLALFNSSDSLHKKASGLLLQLSKKKGVTFILPTTLSEFALLASSRIGAYETRQIVHQLISKGYLSIDITDKITKEAVELYQKQTSKEESLFDCYAMVGANYIKADCIFSFDEGYTKNGFVLIADYFKK